jgi:hypothetical protein
MRALALSFLRALVLSVLWVGVVLTFVLAGMWWPVRNVPEPWAGDGIGMILYGLVGFVFGAIVASIVVSRVSYGLARRRARAQSVAT